VSAGFAAAGTTGDQTLTFPAGQTSATRTVSTQGDTDDEPDGSVTVDLEAGTGYTVASASGTATVAVEDDDKTTVALGRAGSGGIAENGGSVEVTVTLGRELVAGESVTVPLTVTGATVTTHYTLALKSPGGTGVTFSDSAPHSAQNPAVTLAGAGAQTATLVLTAVANADEESRAVAIGYGTGARAPASTGLSGGIDAAGSLSVPIVDDDAMVSVAAASAAEGETVAFKVTLPKPAPAGGVTIGYSTSDGRGVSADADYQVADSADYTAAADGATVTISQGASSGTISIATTQDDTYEGDHHFTLTLGSTSHFNLGTAAATGTIKDAADAPVFAFSAASTDADEDDGALTLTVSKTGTTLLDATVSYATKDGTAIGGSDFTAIASTSLAFAALDTSKDITVTISDDGGDEPEEAFTVELSNPSDAKLGAASSHSITITDDDKTAVTLSAPAGDIAESGGSKVITVTLGRALSGDETLAVPLTFAGAAAFGADYALAAPNPAPTGVTYANLASTDLAASPPTITFTGIDSAASSATITLSASADTTDEGASESVTVGAGTIATAPDGGAAATGTAAFSITDDDTATLSIEDASAAEGESASFTVRLSTPADREVTVTATTSDGTATAAADYTHKTGQLTIAAGDTTAAFNVAIKSDSLNETDEDFTVTLSGATGATISDSTATGTITGNATTLISIAGASAREGQTLTFNLTRTGDLSAASSVTWTTGDDTAQDASGATAGTDYTAVTSPRTVTFAANAGTATLTVASRADALVDGDETFRVNLADPTGATLANGFATGTITEGTTGYAVADASANEGEDLSFKVTRSGLVSGASSVKWRTADDATQGANQATADTDYTSVTTAATLNFLADETAGTITVSSKEDTLDEFDETFAVALSAPSAGGALLEAGAVGTIKDDDATPTVAVAGAAAVTEGDDPATTADMTFAVSLSAAGGRTVTVPFTLGGTASAPADYTLPNPASVEIAAGKTRADIVVPIKGDVVSEGNETVTVTLGAPTNATVSTAQGAGTASGTITDDDDAPSGIALSVDVTSIEEGAAETEVTVTASTGGTTFATAKTVRVTVGGGTSTATSGTDYTGVQPFDIVLNAGTSSATETFDLEPRDDSADELDETIEVTGSESGGATVDAATITLTDDDRTPVALGRTGSGGIAENGGSVEVTVTLGRALAAGESVTVPLAVTGTTVTTHHTLALKTPSGGVGVTFSASAPHSAQNPAVTLAGAGARAATLVLTAVANTDFEGRAVSIGYGTGARKPASTGLSGGIDATGSLSVPIIDDDAMVSVAAASAAEGSAVAFTVTLPKPAPAGGVTVAYSTSDGRGVSADAAYQIATSAADYTAAADGATLTIAQGASSGTVSIATTQDGTYEGDHHFTLTLTSTSHFNLGAATAVGTIGDDADAPVFAFSAASTDADEGDGTVTLTVSKTGSTLLDATVSYSTKDGTAEGGSDFTAIAATSLAFKVADTSKSVTVAVTNDGDDEPPEDFTVELSNPADAQLGAQKSHSIAITDNDKTAVTLSAPAGDISESGGSKVITVTLGRALSG
ncbi:MAG: hypothetical protein F4X09_00710, partial [Gammaproteobacteria bacterium]|nr:hypothetical protein [Gammaproteobacteria bacterium]